MNFAEGAATIACRCVVRGERPVLAVSHAGGEWQMYCDFDAHDYEDASLYGSTLVVVHVAHLVARDGTLSELADLPGDMGAERPDAASPWRRFEDRDD
ncbi:MAG TPA: hypothetical protein PLD37_00780 [Usitatibacteraceae bacterium]|nr:hypothetical protein [Usitatibacteraceae bacterium]